MFVYPINFKNLNYLKHGSLKQREAFYVLKKLNIFEFLKDFTPVLTGTIPIGIDTPESDLDVVCCCDDFEKFKILLINFWGAKKDFNLREKIINGHNSVVCHFLEGNFMIEIFAQNRPVEIQEAYRHMLIEYHILLEKGEEFRKKVIGLKEKGMKTEPAFAKLLGLKGDPYQELLKYESKL